MVTLTASANSGYTFSNWTGNVPNSPNSNNPIQITMDGPKTVTANFTQNQYTLIINISPWNSGTVTKNPDKSIYLHGENVQLTASANLGYIFANWTGDVPNAPNINNPIQITMDGNKTVAAHFNGSLESVTTPTVPNGPINGVVNQTYNYSTGNSFSSLGHLVEYRFDWGNGIFSGWSSSGSATNVWTSTGSYIVKSQARCTVDTSVMSIWSPGLTVNITALIVLVSPLPGAHFTSCSLYSLPTFTWNAQESFKNYEIQFSSDSNFNSPIKYKTSAANATIKSNTWKKVLSLPGTSGGTVYWRVVGTRGNRTTYISEIRTIIIDPASPAGNPTISPTSKASNPKIAWQNNCNVKFKVWFGNNNTFTNRTSFVFNINNPTTNGGIFEKVLTSGQWNNIKNLVGGVSGSTIYWYIESWDGLKRYTETQTMSFVLTN